MSSHSSVAEPNEANERIADLEEGAFRVAVQISDLAGRINQLEQDMRETQTFLGWARAVKARIRGMLQALMEILS